MLAVLTLEEQVTRNANAARYSHLYRGVYPFVYPKPKPDFNQVIWQEDVDERLRWGVSEAVQLGLVKTGDTIIAVQGWRGGLGNTNTYVGFFVMFCFRLLYNSPFSYSLLKAIFGKGGRSQSRFDFF